MPSSLPVPSKGALRTLRRIALGTSCTIAFGAGLITEDRRRRIHTAREASENARRLKTSRNYHSAGIPVAATFEEQVENYCKYGPWKGRDKHQMLDPDWDEAPSSGTSAKQMAQIEPQTGVYLSGFAPTKRRQLGKFDGAKLVHKKSQDPVGDPILNGLTDPILERHGDTLDRGRIMGYGNAKSAGSAIVKEIESPRSVQASRPLRPIETTSDSMGELKCSNREQYLQRGDEKNMSQIQLAIQISALLKESSGGSSTRIRKAISMFNKEYRGDISLQPVGQDLLGACILLAQECDCNEELDKFIPVLTKLLSCGHPVNEESLHKLRSGRVIARLLEQSGYRHADHRVITNVDKLKHAVAIFIAKVCGNPNPLPMDQRDLGLQLCTATLQGHLYEMTEAVYWRLLRSRTDATAAEVECLIVAEHQRAFGDQVLHHFSKYFSQTLPNQNQLYTVVGAAIDSALDLDKIDEAEMILLTSAKMARNCSLRTSTKWYLRVLGACWRTTKNIRTTRALFDRFELDIDRTSHPQAMYSAIIQFCIEAGSEDEARKYLDRLVDLGGGNNVDIRTCGHLALAKAMKNDWAGVEIDFCLMKKLAEGFTSEHSSVFVPILKLFIASHDVAQVEAFIKLYLDDLGVVPNQYIFNTMVDAYCKAGELAKIPSWIEYVQQHGLQIDAVTINTILSNYRRQWDVHLTNLRFYKEAKEKLGPDFDSSTVQTLHRAAKSPITLGRVASLWKVKPPTKMPKCEKLDLEMHRSLGKGNYVKVLKSYKFAMRTGKRISQHGFSFAVQASMRYSPESDLDSTIELISKAQPLGFNIVPSVTHLLLRQAIILDCNGDEFVSVIRHTLAEFDKRGLTVTLFVASKVVSQLIDRGKPREALLLWNTLASNDHISQQPVDLVLLSVLLRAYIMLFDISGIRWVMNAMLEESIIPDMRFKQVLKNARREARRTLDTQPDNLDAKQRYAVLGECMQLVVSHRLKGETQRMEAEQLTLSIIETSLAANPYTSLGESKVDTSKVLHVKRSQRLRNPNEIWKRLGIYAKMGNGSGAEKARGKNIKPPVGDEENAAAEGQFVSGRGSSQEKRVKNAKRMVGPPYKSKQTSVGWPGCDMEPFGGFDKPSSRAVEVASG